MPIFRRRRRRRVFAGPRRPGCSAGLRSPRRSRIQLITGQNPIAMTIWTRRTLFALSILAPLVMLTAGISAQQPRGSSGAAVSSFYDLKTTTLLGSRRIGDLPRQGHACRDSRPAGLRRNIRASKSCIGSFRKSLRGPGLSEQRLWRAGAGLPAGNRRVLQAHIRRDLPDVREGGYEGRPPINRRSIRSRAHRDTCRHGTSANTSSGRRQGHRLLSERCDA